MTARELFTEWCARMDVSTKTMIQCHEEGATSDEYHDGFIEAVKTSMDTMQIIISELN